MEKPRQHLKGVGKMSTKPTNWLEYFYYDETSPTGLCRAKDWMSGANYSIVKAYKGCPAGSLGSRDGVPYYSTSANGKRYRVHRIIWELHFGPIPSGMQIDHIDRDSLNNKLGNLRLVSSKTNSRNQSFRETNTSGVCGVGLLINNHHNKVYRYWKAQWNDLAGKRCAKVFNVATYGEDGAFRLACKYRLKMMKELNKQGAGYTEDHGIC
jgi:hypothetical protein